MTSQPFLYDAQANVLRQRAEMEKPAIQGKFPGVVPEWDKYIEHIKSLPAYTPVSGWVPEVGKEYYEGKDFELSFGTEIAIPTEQKQECKHPHSYTSADSGIQYCVDCDRPVWNVNKKETRSFSLQDMIECWEAASAFGDANCETGGETRLPNKEQFFKTKFNINIDDQGK